MNVGLSSNDLLDSFIDIFACTNSDSSIKHSHGHLLRLHNNVSSLSAGAFLFPSPNKTFSVSHRARECHYLSTVRLIILCFTFIHTKNSIPDSIIKYAFQAYSGVLIHLPHSSDPFTRRKTLHQTGPRA